MFFQILLEGATTGKVLETDATLIEDQSKSTSSGLSIAQTVRFNCIKIDSYFRAPNDARHKHEDVEFPKAAFLHWKLAPFLGPDAVFLISQDNKAGFDSLK